MREKIAVVTGGTGALGSALVGSFLEDGWTVRVPWTHRESEQRLRERVNDAPGLRTAEADLTDPDAVQAFFAQVAADHDHLDALCNVVGGFAGGGVAETEPATWERMWRLNATAPFLAIRSAVPLMGGGGSIVNVAAAAALGDPKAGMSAYLAAKSAVVSLTRSLSAELAGRSITVNAVAPTVIDTPDNRSAMPGSRRTGWLDPGEIARVIRFLTGPDARTVTGNVLTLRNPTG